MKSSLFSHHRKTCLLQGIVLLTLLLSACSPQRLGEAVLATALPPTTAAPSLPADTGSPVSSATKTPVPSATTPAPVQNPTSTSTAVVLQKADPAAPTPFASHPPVPGDVINWLVLGSDARPSEGFHTDVIMLVSIHTSTGKVSVVSFPRDLYVNIPGWTTNRINTALPHGGFKMLQDTFEYNFGIRPTGYVMTNFQGFKGLIDNLGGVDVQASKSLSDHCDLPKGASLKPVRGYCNITPGTHHMDGATALWYVRARYSTSDFDRLRRAQEVVAATFAKLMQGGGAAHLAELYSQYQKNVETNLGVSDLLPLLPIASKVASDPTLLSRYTVAPPAVRGFINRDKADVQLPDFTAIQKILEQAVFTD